MLRLWKGEIFMTDQELMERAYAARCRSYAPYSKFSVGAALLAADGTVYCGCNIENASFTPTCCAERVAFFSALAQGVHHFQKIAIVGAPSDQMPDRITMPCGVCRQVMLEFCSDDFEILVTDGKTITHFQLSEIMPGAFRLNPDAAGC